MLIPLGCWALLLAGCLDESGNSDSPSESGRSIPDISVNCTSVMSPSCDTASDGTEIYFIWASSTCEEIATSLSDEDVGAIKASTATCAGGECDGEATAPWASMTAQTIVTLMPSSSTSAAAWLNFADNGAGDGNGPQSGDVICCAEDQTSDVELTNSDCVPVL